LAAIVSEANRNCTVTIATVHAQFTPDPLTTDIRVPY